MPVHLTGRVCEMNEIKRISKKYGIPIIEDAAQSIGSKYHGHPSGSFGEISCFSAHPLKNLNACGDAGFFVTNNSSFHNRAKILRNHGLEDRNKVKNYGYISRMDVIQAAILNFRLKHLPLTIKKRRSNAKYYLENLDKIAVDNKQKIWSVCAGTNREDYDITGYKYLYNKITNEKSSILHANGPSKWFKEL